MIPKDIQTIIQKDIHSVVISTMDENHHPFSAYLDVMGIDDNSIYFLTSNNGRELYHNLNSSDYISLCGKTDGDYFTCKMIRIQGRIRNIGKDKIDELIDANPYMKKLYPDDQKDKRQIIDVFQIFMGKGSCQDFSLNHPMNQSFSFKK